MDKRCRIAYDRGGLGRLDGEAVGLDSGAGAGGIGLLVLALDLYFLFASACSRGGERRMAAR